jgi:DNA-directed RNA polymerase subunit omega
MSFPPLEQCLERISNRYSLVVLAAKRSRQLNRGAQPQVDTKRKKWTSVALEECIAGKLRPKPKEEEQPKPEAAPAPSA